MLRMRQKPLSCAICLAEFIVGEEVINLRCNESHIFHDACLQSWVLGNYTCPLCREPILNTPAILQKIKTMSQQQANAFGMGEEEYQIVELLANRGQPVS